MAVHPLYIGAMGLSALALGGIAVSDAFMTHDIATGQIDGAGVPFASSLVLNATSLYVSHELLGKKGREQARYALLGANLVGIGLGVGVAFYEALDAADYI